MTTRELANRTGILVLIALVVGSVAAFLWSRLSILPAFIVTADGHADMAEINMGQVASADSTYSIIAVIGGAAIGYACWRLLRRVGWPIAFITGGVATVAGVACWLLGESLGPAPFASRIADAAAGDSVQVALTLHAQSALALWPFAAVAVPLFAASLGPDVDADDEDAPGSEDSEPVAAPATQE